MFLKTWRFIIIFPPAACSNSRQQEVELGEYVTNEGSRSERNADCTLASTCCYTLQRERKKRLLNGGECGGKMAAPLLLMFFCALGLV